MLSSQPPKRVPFGAITGTLNEPADSLNTPMPQGLSPGSPRGHRHPSRRPDRRRCRQVLSSQPPKRVPLGAIIIALSVLPVSFKTPMPQGLVTRSSV